jgi:glycerophosphoryl diester phosphodiesterase
MHVLSHRGYWKQPEEKNTVSAFRHSFDRGFGTETDLRDMRRTIVVSHDPPDLDALPLEALLALYRDRGRDLPLALNVKADGLQVLLLPLLEKYEARNWFIFDMSVPDMLAWLRTTARVFTRQSEIEPSPALYEQAHGVWLDAFFGDWWDAAIVERHLTAGKQVCIVSADLHGRDPQAMWRKLAASGFARSPNLMLCTDRPEEALELFHE